MADRFLLDSSAFIAFLQAEAGAARVLHLLEQAARDQVEVFGCFASLTEVQYIVFYDFGADAARSTVADMRRRRVTWPHSDDALCAAAADVKAAHRISFADSFVVATALRFDAVPVHKDPELAAVPPPLKQEMLPPKTT